MLAKAIVYLYNSNCGLVLLMRNHNVQPQLELELLSLKETVEFFEEP